MVKDKVCIFDTCSLVYIYMHSRKSDAHSLLLKQKRELNSEYILAENDLAKDLPAPLQTKYLQRIRVLFSLQKSPRDELFEEIKQTALDNHRITSEDIRDEKLTDLDIVRLALEYQQEGKEVIIVTDDEGIHNLVKDLGKENDLETLYTHLFFLKMMPYLPEKETKKDAVNNVQESYYYLNNYLSKSNRVLPYEKVINTSINLLSKDYSVDYNKENTLYQEKIELFLKSGKDDPKIETIKPILEVIRKRKLDPEYCSEKACLDLMSKIRKTIGEDASLNQVVLDLVHREFASYHLELADNNHKELNLVGALSHIKAASQSLAFLKSTKETFEKTMEELLFIEALLHLELGSENEAISYLKQLTGRKDQVDINQRFIIESLLIILDEKIGLIKDTSIPPLLELVRESLMIPNTALAKRILSKIIEDDKLNVNFKKEAAREIIHLVNLRIFLKENPIVEKAMKILGEQIIDRTNEKPDVFNLKKVQENFDTKIAETYKGPWEIAEIRTKKKSTWVYAWNEKLKSLWVLEFMGDYPEELDKAKAITLLSGEIVDYKNCTNMEDVKFRQRIQLKDAVLGINEKRALPIW